MRNTTNHSKTSLMTYYCTSPKQHKYDLYRSRNWTGPQQINVMYRKAVINCILRNKQKRTDPTTYSFPTGEL